MNDSSSANDKDECKEDEDKAMKLQPRQLRTDTFEIQFRVQNESTYRLHISLCGSPIHGSPYSVVVRSPAIREEAIRESLFSPCWSTSSSLAKHGGHGRAGSLRGSTVSSSSQKLHSLVINNGNNNHNNNNQRTVSDIEEDDLLVRRIGTAGREPGCFLNPQDICIVNEKWIAVTDSNIGCVQVFNNMETVASNRLPVIFFDAFQFRLTWVSSH